jgi:hypothetical protein
MDLQTIENKALSWGIIGKAAPILAEIAIRESQYILFPAGFDSEGFHVSSTDKEFFSAVSSTLRGV